MKGLDVGEDLKREAVSLLKESKNIRFASPFGTRQVLPLLSTNDLWFGLFAVIWFELNLNIESL